MAKIFKMTIADAYSNQDFWNKVAANVYIPYYRFGHRFKIVEKIEKINDTYYIHVPLRKWENGIESIYDTKVVKVKSTKHLVIEEVQIAKPRKRRVF